MNDLEKLLREDAARSIPDAGFSARVMAALPAARHAPAWLRPALVFGSAVAGSILAAVLAPEFESPVQGLSEWLRGGHISAAALASLAIGGVLLASAVVLALDTE